MPSGRGSSSSSSVLAEAIRLGTAPLAILLAEPDEILVLGALVAGYLYGRTCPIVVLPGDHPVAIATGDQVEVHGDLVTLAGPRPVQVDGAPDRVRVARSSARPRKLDGQRVRPTMTDRPTQPSHRPADPDRPTIPRPTDPPPDRPGSGRE